MTNLETTETTKFNNYDYVNSCILQAYCESLIKGLDTKSLTVKIKNYHLNSFVFTKYYKNGALKVKSIVPTEQVDETGKVINVYTVEIEDFDINAKSPFESETAKCKKGTMLPIFKYEQIGKALKKVLA